jgi:phosphomannomutase/phosphoglucomutase
VNIRSIFREYDIRGIFEKELNEKSVKLIGYFLGLEIIKKLQIQQGEELYIAIGYDARTHSPILKNYLTSGLNKAGLKVLDMGLVATPVNYFSNYRTFYVEELDMILQPSASIMITGSHNPSEYNGFKITVDKKPFFGEDIYALRDVIAQNLFEKIEDNEQSYFINAKEKYVRYIAKDFAHLMHLDKKIVIDGGNGVAGTVIGEIFDMLNLKYEALYLEPDGTFPNHHPDPTVEENLKDIKEKLPNFDIGFAYDGDADRIAVLTQENNIKGDILALLYTKIMAKPIVVGEVKCSQVMYDELNKIGEAHMYKTGHSNIKVKMKELDADLGVEVSGHIFFADSYFGYDDAIYATLRILELLNMGYDLDEEIKKLPQTFSTEEIKVHTTEDEKFQVMERFKNLLLAPLRNFPKIVDIIDVDGIRIVFEHGWGLVRVSNTTPVLVTRFEAKNEEKLKLYQTKINELIQQSLE